MASETSAQVIGKLLAIKRAGAAFGPADIASFVAGVKDGSISDVQLASFCTSVAHVGLSVDEITQFVRAFVDCCDSASWARLDVPGPLLGALYNGGIGDISSLIIGPLVAASGGYCPLTSSRSANGTLSVSDRMTAIPGYDLNQSRERFQKVVRRVGWSIRDFAQDQSLDPLLRFNRAWAEAAITDCMPLMAVSYLARNALMKLDGLAAHIACGGGALITSLTNGQELGRLMSHAGSRLGMPTVVMLSKADAPRGPSFGATLELLRAVDYFSGKSRKEPQHGLIMEMASELLMMGRLAGSIGEAIAMLTHVLDSGLAAEVFNAMVAENGGPKDFIAKARSLLPEAKVRLEVPSPKSGKVMMVDMALMKQVKTTIHSARLSFDAPLDVAAGVSGCAMVDQVVDAGEPLGLIHAADEGEARVAAALMQKAFVIEDISSKLAPSLFTRIQV